MSHIFLSLQILQSQNAIKSPYGKLLSLIPRYNSGQIHFTNHLSQSKLSVASTSQEMFVNGYFKIVFKRQHFLMETTVDKNYLPNNNIFVYEGCLENSIFT